MKKKDALQDYCESYRNDLIRYYNDDFTDEDRKILYESGWAVDLEGRIADCLEINPKYDRFGKYKGAKCWFAQGAPSICLDTETKTMRGYWSSYCEIPVPDSICNAIDAFLSLEYSSNSRNFDVIPAVL